MSTATLDRPAAAPKPRGKSKAAPADSLAQMDVEELYLQLDRCLSFSAEGLKKAAAIVVELLDRKQKVTLARRYPASLLTNLALIGEGRLLPELVIKFAGCPITLIEATRGMPLDRQRELVAGAQVPLVVREGDRRVTKLRDPASLKAAEIRQVFDGERTRPADEQEVPRKAPRDMPARPPGSLIHIFLTVAEREAVDEKARRANKSPAELLRGLLEKAGAFRPPGRRRSA